MADVVKTNPLEAPLFVTKKHRPVDLPTPLAPVADTHGHLTAFRQHDPVVAVARAAIAGVRLLVVPVDPVDDVPDAEEFLSWFGGVRDDAARLLREAGATEALELIDNLYYVAGVHPYGARTLMADDAAQARLDALLDGDRCVGVGEFGLDVGPWSELTLEEQVPAMRMQLRIARERGLPVELHIRDGEGELATAAHDLALEVLREEGLPQGGCDLHCFTSGPDVLAPFVELGCYAAFGGAATFRRSDDIRAAVASCPEHLLLSETDCPYMAPHPLRGKECEPAMVVFNAHNVACVREEVGLASKRQTYEALWRNAKTFFGL